MTDQIKAAIISGTCVVFSAIIGVFNYNINESNKTLTTENNELYEQNDGLQKLYDDLKEKFNKLEDENKLLKNEISEFENEIQSLKNINQKNNSDVIYEQTSEKVSIFDLETFQGEAHWYKNTTFPFSEEDDWLIDMYDNEFHTGYIAFHGDETHEVDAVYNLENKYSQCNIKLAWPRGAKDLVGSGAYIKFYADGKLLYTSPEIKCGDEPIEFSFDLKGVKKFSFERIATGESSAWMSITVIYCYFDLIKNNI